MPYFIQKIFPPIWEKFLTVLLYGPRSQGKSLHQAKLVRSILKYLDNLYSEHQELHQSIVMSNQVFNAKFAEPYLGPRIIGSKKRPKYMAKRIYYWESIQQLKFCPRESCWKGTENHHLHDAYIIFDDIATIIPADGWQDLPKWFRKVFAQAGHNGVHCIANVQDPMSADINFRRYVDVALKFSKIIGNRRPEEAKPIVKYIWGLYMTWRVPAEDLWKSGDMTQIEIERMRKEDPEMFKHLWVPSLHLITRKATEIYDTTQNVPEYMPNSLEHIELLCTDPSCPLSHKGRGHVKHRPI